MKEINWEKVANEYSLTPEQLEEQTVLMIIAFSDIRLESQDGKTKVIREYDHNRFSKVILTTEFVK